MLAMKGKDSSATTVYKITSKTKIAVKENES